MPDTRSIHETDLHDPKEAAPKPSFEQEKIQHPGSVSQMNPAPDHGETTYRGYDRLKDRVALITGGDSGIGRAVALAFAREGADVAISYLPEEEEDAREAIQWSERAGRRGLALPGDIQDERHCVSLIDQVIGTLGDLSLLVNNAAFQRTHDQIEEVPTDELEQTFRTNVFAM